MHTGKNLASTQSPLPTWLPFLSVCVWGGCFHSLWLHQLCVGECGWMFSSLWNKHTAYIHVLSFLLIQKLHLDKWIGSVWMSLLYLCSSYIVCIYDLFFCFPLVNTWLICSLLLLCVVLHRRNLWLYYFIHLPILLWDTCLEVESLN
jgi:hypothetical protein